MRTTLSIVAAILCASLAGCGGSGGDTGASGGDAGSATPAGHGQTLGSRGVPGGTITVSSAGPVQQGAANVFRLALSPGMPTPSAVSAWIGIAYDPAAQGIPATPVAGTPGTYQIAATVPSPLAAGSHVWVRLSFADGSIVETGNGDFPLAGQ